MMTAVIINEGCEVEFRDFVQMLGGYAAAAERFGSKPRTIEKWIERGVPFDRFPDLINLGASMEQATEWTRKKRSLRQAA